MYMRTLLATLLVTTALASTGLAETLNAMGCPAQSNPTELVSSGFYDGRMGRAAQFKDCLEYMKAFTLGAGVVVLNTAHPQDHTEIQNEIQNAKKSSKNRSTPPALSLTANPGSAGGIRTGSLPRTEGEPITKPRQNPLYEASSRRVASDKAERDRVAREKLAEQIRQSRTGFGTGVQSESMKAATEAGARRAQMERFQSARTQVDVIEARHIAAAEERAADHEDKNTNKTGRASSPGYRSGGGGDSGQATARGDSARDRVREAQRAKESRAGPKTGGSVSARDAKESNAQSRSGNSGGSNGRSGSSGSSDRKSGPQ